MEPLADSEGLQINVNKTLPNKLSTSYNKAQLN